MFPAPSHGSDANTYTTPSTVTISVFSGSATHIYIPARWRVIVGISISPCTSSNSYVVVGATISLSCNISDSYITLIVGAPVTSNTAHYIVADPNIITETCADSGPSVRGNVSADKDRSVMLVAFYRLAYVVTYINIISTKTPYTTPRISPYVYTTAILSMVPITSLGSRDPSMHNSYP